MDSSSSSPRSTPSSSADSKQGAVGRPAPVQLTEEEKAVLLECRRNSIARGLPLGVASVVVLRWLVANGRVPAYIQRWSWFYYTGAFLGTFVMGVASYRQTCFDKIMALENSVLANQVREHFKGIQRPSYDKYDGDAVNNTEMRRPQYRHHQQQEQRTYPPIGQYRQRSNLTQTLDAPSTINSDAYSRDKAALDTMEKPVEQPDAFGSEGAYPQSFNMENRQDDLNTPPKQPRGRTFDEIREEHRRRQLQQNFPRSPPSRSTTDRKESIVEGDWRQTRNPEHQPGSIKRKNKYGDVVYED